MREINSVQGQLEWVQPGAGLLKHMFFVAERLGAVPGAPTPCECNLQ
jgi:hypothetical protein